jgi:hypothetical protein
LLVDCKMPSLWLRNKCRSRTLRGVGYRRWFNCRQVPVAKEAMISCTVLVMWRSRNGSQRFLLAEWGYN